MVTVALRQVRNGEELAADGEVKAVATDLQGLRQPISFIRVRTGEYTDYVGTFAYSANATATGSKSTYVPATAAER